MQLITIFNKSDTRRNDKKSSRNIRVRVNGQIVNNLRFADDIDLIAETMEDLQEITDKVNENSKRFGLEINKQKNESCGCGEEALQREDKSREYKLEQVSNFVYLSGLMTEDGKCRYKKTYWININNGWKV